MVKSLEKSIKTDHLQFNNFNISGYIWGLKNTDRMNSQHFIIAVFSKNPGSERL